MVTIMMYYSLDLSINSSTFPFEQIYFMEQQGTTQQNKYLLQKNQVM